ncbi:MAG TPA: hypothetical protein DCR97_14880 [Deltaproteobacteria bacterium]|nr:hypothetical protein [Deltaproteobacteria bacterium]
MVADCVAICRGDQPTAVILKRKRTRKEEFKTGPLKGKRNMASRNWIICNDESRLLFSFLVVTNQEYSG